MKGYKAFNNDLKCRDMQFEVGKTFEVSGEIVPCKNGIHFCENLKDVYNYYAKDTITRVCEVEAIGKIVSEGDKSVTNQLRVVREIDTSELMQITDNFKFNSGYYNSGDYNSGDCNSGDYNSGDYNSGNYNSGDCNSGYRNSGNYNSGDCNSGYRNSGDYNSGDYNSGYYNSGDYNSGDCNSGDYNSGDYNSGDYNSGDYNSGNYNSGYYNSGDYNSGYYNSGDCNTDSPTVRIFNKDSGWTFFDDNHSRFRGILSVHSKLLLKWTLEKDMTEQEKKDNPSYKTTRGFLSKNGVTMRGTLSESDRDFLLSVPNFDADILFETTGIKIKSEKEKRIRELEEELKALKGE